MVIKKFLDKMGFNKNPEESEEVELEHQPDAGNPIHIRIENLGGMGDVERVSKFVKDGNVLFLKLKELQRRDIGEFQNALQKMKRVCSQYKWDLVALEEGYLIVTPEFAKIARQ